MITPIGTRCVVPMRFANPYLVRVGQQQVGVASIVCKNHVIVHQSLVVVIDGVDPQHRVAMVFVQPSHHRQHVVRDEVGGVGMGGVDGRPGFIHHCALKAQRSVPPHVHVHEQRFLLLGVVIRQAKMTQQKRGVGRHTVLPTDHPLWLVELQKAGPLVDTQRCGRGPGMLWDREGKYIGAEAVAMASAGRVERVVVGKRHLDDRGGHALDLVRLRNMAALWSDHAGSVCGMCSGLCAPIRGAE